MEVADTSIRQENVAGRSAWVWNDFLALAVCSFIGFALTTLPHWLAYARTGSLIWVADHDELDFYLPMGARAYHEHPTRLADPATNSGETYYKSLPAVPGVVLARARGTGPLLVGFWWRALGGAVIGAAWYGFVRLFLTSWAAFIAAVVLLCDPGTVSGQIGISLIRHVGWLLAVPTGQLIPEAPYWIGLSQCRILNPVQSWPWWLLFLGLVYRARQRPTRSRIGTAGVGFGLLFYVYFYLWTTAGFGLLLAAILDRRSTRIYFGIAVIGALLGLPTILDGMDFRSRFGQDWMHRTDKFLPIGRWHELLIPKITLLLVAVQWVWVAVRRRDLIWLASIGLAGLLLLNQQVITGLQMENFHWNLAFGPVIATLTVLMVADVADRWGPLRGAAGRWVGGVLALIMVFIAGWVYATAATRCFDPVVINTRIREFLACDSIPPLATRETVAGDPYLVSLSAARFDLRPLAGYAAYLSPISDRELDERTALNAILLGQSRAELESEQRTLLANAKWSLAARSESERNRQLAARLAAWDDIQRDVAGAENRFAVRYLILRTGERVSQQLSPEWQPLHRCPFYTVWAREP